MPVKVYKPTSAGRRDMTGHSFEEITQSKPERSVKRAGVTIQGVSPFVTVVAVINGVIA